MDMKQIGVEVSVEENECMSFWEFEFYEVDQNNNGSNKFGFSHVIVFHSFPDETRFDNPVLDKIMVKLKTREKKTALMSQFFIEETDIRNTPIPEGLLQFLLQELKEKEEVQAVVTDVNSIYNDENVYDQEDRTIVDVKSENEYFADIFKEVGFDKLPTMFEENEIKNYFFKAI